MELGEEGFDDSGPYEEGGDAADEGGEVGGDLAQSFPQALAVAEADERAAEEQPGLPGDEDGGNFDRAVGQQPAGQEYTLSSEQVVGCDRAENYPVVEKQDQSADAVEHARGEGEDGPPGVVGHEHRGEGAFAADGPAIAASFPLLFGDALAGIAGEVAELGGDEGPLGLGIGAEGEAAEESTQEHDRGGEGEEAAAAAESLGEGGEEPVHGTEAQGLAAGLVDLAVGAAHQRFEVAAEVVLARTGAEPGEIGGGSLVEVVQALKVLDPQGEDGLALDAGELGIEFAPERSFGIEEVLEVDDHRSCFRLMERYWPTRWALRVPRSTWVKRTPRARSSFSRVARRLHWRCPPSLA